MRHLAIIPARGGSKGFPKKNMRVLLDKPMIAYSIEAAQQSKCFDKVIVSTECDEIAKIASAFKADVPFVRPKELATDTAKILDVILHTLDFFESKNQFYDMVTLLQPTSPLRTAEDIRLAMQLLVEREAESIVSVCSTDHSPLWTNVLPEDQNLEHFLDPKIMQKRRQELPAYYRINGAIYMIKTSVLRKARSFYTAQSYAYVMPRNRSIDVDEALDFYLCETLLMNR
ncbi:MAG: acylneuraminate cytidylyltransferase family protein [Gammaproteobacteria bacterium]|nr:acylneuraminate cytidylyltransferase family protein [Gammaproteobacteria bacterium]